MKVTFLGNSLTYLHDLPEMIKDMAKAAGDKIKVESYSPGGWTFYKHANSEGSYRKLSSQKVIWLLSRVTVKMLRLTGSGKT